MLLLQKCSKFTKYDIPLTKDQKLDKDKLSYEIERICSGLPTLVQNVNYDDVSDMLDASNWRLIYSTTTPICYKKYEYILGEYTKYIYIKKDNQSKITMECNLVRKNNKINIIYPDTATYAFPNKTPIDILPLYNIGTNSYEIIYLSEKIRIQQILHTKKYEVYYRII
jgi:hypothetical protein